MRSNFTDITVVMDRSGSMASCHADAEGGLNHFVDEQKKQPGDAAFTLAQFDNRYEVVHQAVPIRMVPRCTLSPRGSTALLDAIGRAMTETGQRLAAMNEADRPGLVVFVIVTDGQENASCQYSLGKIREMIRHQQDVYKWQFTYLGANQDAFAEADSMGISGAVANTTNATQQEAWVGASANVLRMRKAKSRGAEVTNAYTTEELDAMGGK
jgi:hypothetical protein